MNCRDEEYERGKGCFMGEPIMRRHPRGFTSHTNFLKEYDEMPDSFIRIDEDELYKCDVWPSNWEVLMCS